ncbi:hypothetical protein ANO11243_018420 [Dothideomycetidae sp. 11243]|nr:hypothetical protein ANO11243_018420 [fungal sp. No.11243]
MAHRILLTGASGYLGGTILAQLKTAGLPQYDRMYALVRTEEQSKAVREYGAEQIAIDITEGEAIRRAVVEAGISVIIFTIDSRTFDAQRHFIDALAKVKKARGIDVHFIHVRSLAITWPVSHIKDTTSLYLQILKAILQNKDIGSGPSGYYLAASGSVAWEDIYASFAEALANRGVVDSRKVPSASDADLKVMGKGLGVPKEFVALQLGGE